MGARKGYLAPGILAIPYGSRWDDPAVRERAAEEAIAAMVASPKAPPFDARVIVMALIDWHLSRRPAAPWAETTTPEGFTLSHMRPHYDVQEGVPLPGYALRTLAVALQLPKKHGRDASAEEAQRLRAEGCTLSEIARRLGLPTDKPASAKRQVQRLLKKDAPDHGWTSPADVVASVRTIAKGGQRLAVRQRLYDAVAWFSDRGEPLPYAIWWALVCCLDLGRGALPVLLRPALPVLDPKELELPAGARFITDGERRAAEAQYRALGWSPEEIAREIAALGPTAAEVRRECEEAGYSDKETERALKGLEVIRGVHAYGLTDTTIKALSDDIKKPEGFQAAARKVGKARASLPRGHSRKGCEPLSVYAVARTVADATAAADHRRGTEAETGIADRSDTVTGWLERADWERATWSQEIMARWNLKQKRSNPIG